MGNFAKELNKMADEAKGKSENVLSKDEFIANRIRQYTRDIKDLCKQSAGNGSRSLKGFFVPTRQDNNYDVSTDDSYIIDKPKNLISKKPGKNALSGGLRGGNEEIQSARIYLFDGWSYDKPITFAVDSNMIEKVRLGVVRNLSKEGFKKLNIEHLNGPIYKTKEVLFSEIIVQSGTASYFYLDIAW